jgi:hypothetical protein
MGSSVFRVFGHNMRDTEEQEWLPQYPYRLAFDFCGRTLATVVGVFIAGVLLLACVRFYVKSEMERFGQELNQANKELQRGIGR